MSFTPGRCRSVGSVDLGTGTQSREYSQLANNTPTCRLGKCGEVYFIPSDAIQLGLTFIWDGIADVDVSAILINHSQVISDLVWFKKPKSNGAGVQHLDEPKKISDSKSSDKLKLDLRSMPDDIQHIVFVANVYSYDMSFSDIRSVECCLCQVERVLCSFRPAELEGNGMMIGRMTRCGSFWNFRALGHPATGRTVTQLLRNPKNIDIMKTQQPMDSKPRQITIKVDKGSNLAVKDKALLYGPGTSDPYYSIEFKDSHCKSKPILKSLNPEWEMMPFDMGVITPAEQESLKVEVFDKDAVKKDDFMGEIQRLATELYSLGLGTHECNAQLEASSKRKGADCEVSGHLHFTVTVSEAN